jgi:copper chaperone CopZ
MHVRLKNLLVTPSGKTLASDARGLLVRVDGLACDAVCARRVKTSLARLPGVSRVEYRPDDDSFLLVGTGEVPESAVNRAVQRAAVAMPVRRLIGRLTRKRGVEADT